MMNHRIALFSALFLAPLLACSDGGGTAGPTPNDPNDDADETADATPSPADGGGTKADAGSKSDASTFDTTCTSGTVLTAGKAVTLAAAKNGNPQRNYCIIAPPSATGIEITMKGGSCSPYKCSGDDVVITLKHGVVPDAFEPDSKTKQWTYTPAAQGFGTYGTGANGGVATYISLIDGAYTLGYTGVTMSVAFK